MKRQIEGKEGPISGWTVGTGGHELPRPVRFLKIEETTSYCVQN